MSLSLAAATALAAGTSTAGSVGGGLFSINQAAKNRAFQERMYERQIADSLEFWNKENEYNLPSAQLQRLQDAGLSPLLMYGNGGLTGNIAQNAPSLPSAPKGAQAHAESFNTQVDIANLALLKEQGEYMKSMAAKNYQDIEESKQRAFGQAIQNEINWRTRDAQVAMKEGDVNLLNQQIEWIATQDFALTNMTAANLDNIASMVEYRQKYYDLDNQKMLNDFWYQVESIAIGKQHVSNELKQIGVAMYNARTNRARVDGELKVFNASINEINSRTDLNEQQKSNMILDSYNTFLKNSMLENIGTDNLGGAAGLMLLLTGKMSGRL